MLRTGIGLSLIGLVVACGDGLPAAELRTGRERPSRDDGSASELKPPVECGSPLPGPTLRPERTEAQPGYAQELAALDLRRVPDPLDYSTASKLTIAVVNYMLGRSAGTQVSHHEALQKGGLGQAVLAAAAKTTDGRIDFPFLRRGFYYFYPCSRPLPASLLALRLRYGDYRLWPSHELGCARPKNGPRRFYQDHELGVYIAETVVEGRVRETEVLFSGLRSDGQLDFAAYTAAGELSDRSTFAAADGKETVGAAPYTCISCHLDGERGTVSRLSPTGTGAGCR
jgi:hypothetical protein